MQPIVLLFGTFFKKRRRFSVGPTGQRTQQSYPLLRHGMVRIKGRRLDLNLPDRAHITAASFPELGTPKAPTECLLKAISEKAIHWPEETMNKWTLV